MRTFRELEELLDSDDEFPSAFNEASLTPAYKNDYRFDVIKFKWIYDTSLSTKWNLGDEDNANVYFEHSPKKDHPQNPKLNRDVMKAQDLFCIKSIAHSITSSTLLWLVNFMIIKDIQSNYSFLTSCLVTETSMVMPRYC